MYHVEKIFRLNKIVIIICNIVLAVVLLLLARPIGKAVSAIHTYEVSSYRYLGSISVNDVPAENSYYANVGYISFFTGDEKYLSCDNLMTREGTDYNGNYLTRYNGKEVKEAALSEGECAISANLSLRYNIHEGDYIRTRINFKDYFAIVKYTFEPYYGLKEANIFNDIGLIVLGYDENIIRDAITYDIVHFAEKSVFFADSDISVKENVISGLRRICHVLFGFLILIAFIICLVLDYFCSDDIRNDVLALRYMGLSEKRVFRYNFLDAFYKCFAIYTVPLLGLAAYSSFVQLNCMYELFVVFFCFCITVLYFVVKNERAVRRR